MKLKRIEKRGERQKRKHELQAKYAEYYPSKHRKVSNVMLVVIVIAIVGFAIADYILQYYMGMEISSTLTTCWFSFWGAEIVGLTGIKVSKVLKTYRQENEEDSVG